MGRYTNDLLAYSMLFVFFGTFSGGYIFDLFGRKVTLILSLIICTVMLAFIPYTSPSYNWLFAIRMLLALFHTPLSQNPLTMDYFRKDSRGKATSYNTMGVLAGEIFCFTVLI